MGYRTSIEKAALKTLEQLGYTWHEGELWKPPIGKSASPLLDKIDLLEARIAALTKDAEPVAHIYPWDLERFKTQETHCTVCSVAVGCSRGESVPLYTHPPAPKAITADMVTDEMIDLVETTTTGAGAWDMVKPKELIAAAVNAFNGVKP